MSRASLARSAYRSWAVAGRGGAALLAICLSFASVTSRPPLAAADEPLPTWTTSDIPASGDAAPSLAMDGDGVAHVCWLGSGDLVYATDATGSWVLTTLDSPGSGLTYSSAIAVDEDGDVHIAYDGMQSLRYATNASGSWVVTTVDDPGYDVGDDVSLDLDSLGHPHVAYLDRTNGHLRYATDASGAWVVTDLGASPGSGGYQTSLDVDAFDSVHVIHSRFVPSSQLLWTTNASGGWLTTSLDGTGGYYNSVKADSQGHIHVSFFNGNLYYGTTASGSWKTTFIDNDLGNAPNSSLVLDSAGRVHITYHDYAERDLRYATNSLGADPAQWDLQLLDGDGDKGYRSALAVDADDNLHVVYPDRDELLIRYATTRLEEALETECRAVARQDGWILESRPGAGVGRRRVGATRTLLVGDDARNRQYRSILSFRTVDIPAEAVIVSATLRMQRRKARGTDPFTTLGNLVVDMGPGFGRTAALRRGDFQAEADNPAVGVVGETEEEGVYEAMLDPTALAGIDRTGVTQFRLAFETATDSDRARDRAIFFSGSARPVARRPTLEILYRVP